MNSKLSELERLRLDKLKWLYLLEAGDEDSDLVSGSVKPTASELYAVLLYQDIMLNPDDVEAIVQGKAGISDELAAAIEEGFNLSSGWLSQA